MCHFFGEILKGATRDEFWKLSSCREEQDSQLCGGVDVDRLMRRESAALVK